jgi:hypothetical protein
MKPRVLFALMGIVTLPVTAAELSPYATKAGQWEMTTRHNGQALPVIRTCVDEETAAKAERNLASSDVPSECKVISQKATRATMHFEYACEEDGKTVRLRGQGRRVSDDAFESRVETLEGNQVVAITEVSGRWLGQCPAQGKNTVDIPGMGQMDMDQLKRMAEEWGAGAER